MLYGVCQLIISYLFGTFTDTIRKPMKIGCADGVYSHLNHTFTASSASDADQSLSLYNLNTNAGLFIHT